jgi:hypothetical protein
MKIYTVYEIYDVDGGFGDAIPQTEDIYTFVHKEDAYAFKEKYNNPRVYATPYQKLWCGTLEVKEMEIIDKFDPNDDNISYKSRCW